MNFSVNLLATTTTSLPAVLSVIATSATSIEYQWYKNSSIIQAYSSSNSLLISSANTGDQYYCIAKDANANTITSVTTTLNITQTPIVVSFAPINSTVPQNYISAGYLQPFTVSGVDSYSITYNSSLSSPSAPGISVSADGITRIISPSNTIGTYTYYFTVYSGIYQKSFSSTLNVVSNITYNSHIVL